MNNKRLEYILVIVLTWLHGMVTVFTLGYMPVVQVEYLLALDKWAIIGFGLWAVYGAGLYFVAQISRLNATNILTYSIKAALFGLATAGTKSVFDYIGTKVTAEVTMKVVAVSDGVVSLLFGVLMIFIIHTVVSKKKVSFSFSKAGLPLMFIIGAILVYIIVVATCYSENYKAIETFNATVEEIQNLDFHFARKILKANPILFELGYIFFWWFMNRLTEEKTQNGF